MQIADDRDQDMKNERGDYWGRGGGGDRMWRDTRPWSDDEWRSDPNLDNNVPDDNDDRRNDAIRSLPRRRSQLPALCRLSPAAHVHQASCDCRCRRHRRRDEMGSALEALSPFEIAIGRRGAALARR